ncbi:chemotaxis protein CheB [Marinicella sp. S1101]|uniref:chemotaxis protein CheB n=1 Tax=Marinicella marina TaxID=2996016 RepID=UPI002260D6C9|nr:chemotaxis protein CheB [Marinicella marina]MCX7554764.1 chemotaxis protein CheB [Marinicella marina]MDJ1141003.1 chemotaxis protein CheB [Marinicella marina]
MHKNPVVGLIHIGEVQTSAQFLINQLKTSGYQVKQYSLDEIDEIDGGIKTFILNLFDNDLNLDALIRLLDENDANIIFNDARISNELVGWNKNRWLRHVLHKIDQANDILPKDSAGKTDDASAVDLSTFGIKSVWILGASIGGPESLLKFLSEFEGDEQVLFIIVQHMDSEFVSMMEKQLAKNNKIAVKLAQSGAAVEAGQAILVPVDEDIVINSNGKLAVKDVNPKRMYTPCIDDVCFSMLENLSKVNMAVFSGMAKDGIRGATNVFENGGRVITQSAESCVVSAIAEEIRSMNMSMFDGDPTGMAQYIKENLN